MPVSSYYVRATRTTRPASGIFNDEPVEIWGTTPDRQRVTIRGGDCLVAMSADLYQSGNEVWSVTTLDGQQYAFRADANAQPSDLLMPLSGTPAEALRRAQQLA